MFKLEINPAALASNPRATQANWLRFKTVVDAALAQHPATYVFCPKGMTPCTYASRIREAVRGCIAFHYEGIEYSQKLESWYSEVVVRYDAKNVYLGAKEVPEPVPITGSSPSTQPSGLVFTTLTPDELEAFALLLYNGRILGPVKVLQPPEVWTEPPNCDMIRRPDGALILL